VVVMLVVVLVVVVIVVVVIVVVIVVIVKALTLKPNLKLAVLWMKSQDKRHSSNDTVANKRAKESYHLRIFETGLSITLILTLSLTWTVVSEIDRTTNQRK
jgi:predicted Holliday junction resolvase-like endonuclease